MSKPNSVEVSMHRAHILAVVQAGAEIREITMMHEDGHEFAVDFCYDKCEKCTNYARVLWDSGYHRYVREIRAVNYR